MDRLRDDVRPFAQVARIGGVHLSEGDEAEARDWYGVARRYEESSKTSLSTKLQDLKSRAYEYVQTASELCRGLEGADAPLLAAIEVLDRKEDELGLAASTYDTSRATTLAREIDAKANSCELEADAVVDDIERGYEYSKAEFEKMVEKAKSLGW